MTQKSGKREQMRSRQRRQQMRSNLIWSGLGLAALVVIGAMVWQGARPRAGEEMPVMQSDHIPTDSDPGEYSTNPPTSGPHTPYLADWGVHKIPVPLEIQVHNLEDGGVMVQYACEKPCDELVKQLEALAAKHDRLIVAPYPLMNSKIALTAWQRIETLDSFDEKRINDFIQAYIGKDHHLPGGEPSSDGSTDPFALPPMHPQIKEPPPH